MKRLKRYCLFFLLLILLILLLQNSGCTKEYSFEGANVDTIGTDTTGTTPSSPSTLPQCSLCNAGDSLILGHWSFETDNVYVCGTFSNSGFFDDAEKTNFTLSGPSACSADTGIEMSVYLPVSLDSDRSEISATKTAFHYHDVNGVSDIFQSRVTAVFSATVKNYSYATHIVTGTFSGIVYKANGDTAYIDDGRFIAPLH